MYKNEYKDEVWIDMGIQGLLLAMKKRMLDNYTYRKKTEQYRVTLTKKQWAELDIMCWIITDKLDELYEQIESMETSMVGMGMEMHKRGYDFEE